MRHLTPQEALDLAEGVGDGEPLGHAAACEGCRRQVAELKATIAAARNSEVPEPSPLFWTHLSARVRDRVGAEPLPERSWAARLVPRSSLGMLGGWRVATAVGACLVILAAVLSWRAHTARPPATADGGASALEASASPPASADEASLILLSDLASDLDWDGEAEAGLVSPTEVVDRAITELNAGERVELKRLLNEELSRPGA
jgi:hypothetical protein